MSKIASGTALITGASTGIGATYARKLAAAGHDLILVARDAQRLATLASEVSATHGVKAEVLKADLTDRAELAMVEQRLRDDAAISVLVNNAGMAVSGTFLEVDIDKVETMVSLNVVSVLRLAHAAARAFAARKAGTIINVASVLALAPELFSGPYSGTKAFVLNLSISLQRELADKGVTVQAVLPGATRTEIWERGGTDINSLPAEMLMEVDEMVEAALTGLELGETITIPPLPDFADYEAMTAARLKMAPNLSRNEAAARYKAGKKAA
jgi:short-subunit dehydrogenase